MIHHHVPSFPMFFATEMEFFFRSPCVLQSQVDLRHCLAPGFHAGSAGALKEVQRSESMTSVDVGWARRKAGVPKGHSVATKHPAGKKLEVQHGNLKAFRCRENLHKTRRNIGLIWGNSRKASSLMSNCVVLKSERYDWYDQQETGQKEERTNQNGNLQPITNVGSREKGCSSQLHWLSCTSPLEVSVQQSLQLISKNGLSFYVILRVHQAKSCNIAQKKAHQTSSNHIASGYLT